MLITLVIFISFFNLVFFFVIFSHLTKTKLNKKFILFRDCFLKQFQSPYPTESYHPRLKQTKRDFIFYSSALLSTMRPYINECIMTLTSFWTSFRHLIHIFSYYTMIGNSKQKGRYHICTRMSASNTNKMSSVLGGDDHSSLQMVLWSLLYLQYYPITVIVLHLVIICKV